MEIYRPQKEEIEPSMWFIKAPLIIVVGTFFLSYVYAYVSVYSPFVGYVTFLFLMAYLYGLFFVKIMAFGTLSGPKPFTENLMGLGIGLFGLYCTWAVFIYALMAQSGEGISMVDLFFSPLSLWDIILMLNANGWFSLGLGGESNVKGVVLWIIWGVEALCIVLGPMLIDPTATEE